MKKSSIRRRRGSREISLGFQIAPMIDVVFVILLFFMVAAGNAQKETALNHTLPAADGPAPLLALPDEIEVRIDASGQVFLNGESLDDPKSKQFPELEKSLRELKQAAGDDPSKVRVLLAPDEAVPYQRVVDVMDLLAREKISAVNFQAMGAD